MIDADINILSDKSLSQIKQQEFKRGQEALLNELYARVRNTRKLASITEIEEIRSFLLGGYDKAQINAVCDTALLALKLLNEQ